MNPARFKQWITAFQNELGVVSSTFKDRGAERFSRPLILGGVIVFLSYAALYAPPVKKMAVLQRRINSAKAIATYADQYKTLRDRLSQVSAQLPTLKEREQWLTTTILETMKAEGIIADQIMPPDETEQPGYYTQKVQVTAQVKFSELAGWLNRVEATKPLVHVFQLEVGKREDVLGKVDVNCGIATLIPSHR